MTTLLSLIGRVTAIAVVVILAGCQLGSGKSEALQASLSIHEQWSLQALNNETDSAGISDVGTTLLETHLRRRKLLKVLENVSPLRYEVSGDITQWHYVGNVSPRPVVAIKLHVRDVQSESIVWSSSMATTGKRRQTLSALGDSVFGQLVSKIPLNNNRNASTQQLASGAEPVPVIGSAQSTSVITSLAGGFGLRSRDFDGRVLPVNTPTPLQGRSIAFYYAAKPPTDVLSQFDRLVLEPDNINNVELSELKSSGARTYAYLSVGEVGPYRSYARLMNDAWMLGENPAWNSRVLDLSNVALREFLLERVGKLRADGYHGLFLDTMDSFNLVAKTEPQRLAQRTGLIILVGEMATRYPDMRLITNRGFEVLDDIAPHIEAVAAESLYAAWDNSRQTYTTVTENDRQWLLGKLNHVQDDLNLDVIVIDYLPPARRAEASTVAARIAEHGFIPWVANPELDYVGIGALEVIPRKVLMLYDSAVYGPVQESPVFRFVATPVEYMGYVPEFLDISTEALPAGELKGRYAGIVTWTNKHHKQVTIRPWLQKQLDDRVPVAFLGNPPVALDDAMLTSIGIELSDALDFDSARLSHSDEFIQPEKTLNPRIDGIGLAARSVGILNSVHMSYQDDKSAQSDVVVTGPFGGFAWQPAVLEVGLDSVAYWVLEPFGFLRAALQLPDAPMPDVTTENGKRLWLAHIDGDALPSWAEMPGRKLGAEIIYDQILAPYKLPHTISVVEGEMIDKNYVDRRKRMFDIARKTFELDFVELASHTYSHPLKWGLVAGATNSGRYNLPIEGYEYSAERETAGSIGFIDRELAPPGKRTELMLWSGDALPGVEELAVLDRLGIPNMNGGITNATYAKNSMTLISPMARPVGEYTQVYAPIMNENMYTNFWRGPFNGFHRVIETFELTESPRRLKPLNIYYHFYSGTKVSAMRALKDVYEWTLEQDIHPVYGSAYAIKVPDYQAAGVARYLDGQWKLSALGNVRSVRLVGESRWPELLHSKGIAGARSLHDGVYIHTDGADQVLFNTQKDKPAQIHLVSSNGKLMQWDDTSQGLTFRVAGQVPVTVELGGNIVSTCSLRVDGQPIKGVRSTNNTVTFTFTSKDTGNASLNCPA